VNEYIAKAQTTIHAPASRVWKALTDPELIRQYMFGTEVVGCVRPTSVR
jgi:uncharacterized protein YndB with AHSA1/START domain